MARTDHCWTDVVDPSEQQIYADFFKRTGRGVGDKPALLAIDLYNKVYAGGPLPVAEVNKTHPGSCGINAYNAIEPTKQSVRGRARCGNSDRLHHGQSQSARDRDQSPEGPERTRARQRL